MKQQLIFSLAAFAVMFTAGCLDKPETVTFKANTPVYLSNDQVQHISSGSPQPISKPGKIYLAGNYLFINELMKGIHVIDNSNPASPQLVSFLNIPGNVDVAVKDNIMYADNLTDLVAIDMKSVSAPVVMKRIPRQFPYSIPQYNKNYPVADVDSSLGMIVSWEIRDVTRVCNSKKDCYQGVNTSGVPVNGSWQVYSYSSSSSASSSGGSGKTLNVKRNVGIGGSLGRFTIHDKYLYLASRSSILVYDISTPADPVYISKVFANTDGEDIETLFIFESNLFVGSSVSVVIYRLNNPSSPSYVSRFTHVRSCDPVVAGGDYAYSTQRGNTGCGGTVNQLDVIDISNISSPVLREDYPMSEPYGLGLDDNTLYVCDGGSGLKVFDLSAAPNLIMKQHYTDISAHDVIPWNNILIVIGNNGLVQYNNSDPDKLVEISHISLN